MGVPSRFGDLRTITAANNLKIPFRAVTPRTSYLQAARCSAKEKPGLFARKARDPKPDELRRSLTEPFRLEESESGP
jgi:hypothetical protein